MMNRMNNPSAIGGLVHFLYSTNISMNTSVARLMKYCGRVMALIPCLTTSGGKVIASAAAMMWNGKDIFSPQRRRGRRGRFAEIVDHAFDSKPQDIDVEIDQQAQLAAG